MGIRDKGKIKESIVGIMSDRVGISKIFVGEDLWLFVVMVKGFWIVIIKGRRVGMVKNKGMKWRVGRVRVYSVMRE